MCLDHGFALFFMACVQFRPYGRRTRFLPVTRGKRFSPCRRTWIRMCLDIGFALFFMARFQFRPYGRRNRFFTRERIYTFLARVAVHGSAPSLNMVLPCF